MRVVAGRFGGRALVAPRGRATRPTSDRVREALFSILGGLVEGARVLDLFAGSGALAIEALSRGASEADLVDSSAAAVAAIRRNLSSGRSRTRRCAVRTRSGTSSGHAGTLVNTIWCSSILHIGTRARSGGSCRRRWRRFWRPVRG